MGNGNGSTDGAIGRNYRCWNILLGTHARNLFVNQGSITVCLAGNIESQSPAPSKFESLIMLPVRICRNCGIVPGRIRSRWEVDPEPPYPAIEILPGGVRAALERMLSPKYS
ncbi:MAG: N-acetylmuramoyl-L-alanine amidase [Nitrospirae bacterium]|nr:N-acetylmuramoyl-L-alanine amidase [Nitrospirota bacterium]